MTTKTLFVATVLVLASARTATAGEKCLDWPFDLRPAHITQHFHDTRPGFNPTHTGIDITLPPGTVLNATFDGVVDQETGVDLYGANVVVIRVGNLRILLGHLSRIAVQVGDKVENRSILGNSGGSVGAEGSGTHTTGPHLHLSVFNPAGQPIDPEAVFCK